MFLKLSSTKWLRDGPSADPVDSGANIVWQMDDGTNKTVRPFIYGRVNALRAFETACVGP